MMMTLSEEFSIRYPEFLAPPAGQDPVKKSQIKYWLADAEDFLCPNRFGSNYRRAVLAYAASSLAMALKQTLNGAVAGEPGAVASASVGGESVSYNAMLAEKYKNSAFAWVTLYPPYGFEFLTYVDQLSGVETTRTFQPFGEQSCG